METKKEAQIDKLLSKMQELGASDLHLVHGSKISYRVDGSIEQMGPTILGEDIMQLVFEILETEEQRTFHIKKNIDFSRVIPGTQNRFRGNLSYVDGQASCVFRKIDAELIPLEELGLPHETIKQIIEEPWGLFLVTGATGSGKSKTLAAIIDHINKNKPYHIATYENPIEYRHKNKKSIITQHEVGLGKDVPSFYDGASNVLRIDPDVIMIGEMRDEETIRTALTHAETGHLVLATLHTNTAPDTVNRIIDAYPPERQDFVYSVLAQNLKGVINQRLYKKKNGEKGRFPIFELMVVRGEIKELIRKGEIHKIHEAMKNLKEQGNVLLQDSYRKAVEKGWID